MNLISMGVVNEKMRYFSEGEKYHKEALKIR